MQWHGDGHIGAAEHVHTARFHQRAEWFRQRPAAVVLECVNDRPERAIVGADSPRSIDCAGETTTSWTHCAGETDDTPCWEWIAAQIAERRGQRLDGTPATEADRPAGWTFERLSARGAAWRQQDRQQRIGEP